MAPAMPHARAWQRALSRLFSGLGQTRSRAQCGSDNASASRSDSTAIVSRSTTHPNSRQPGTVPGSPACVSACKFDPLRRGIDVQH